MNNKKIIILLSGQIASGKSTICNELEKEFGFEVVRTSEIINRLAQEKHKGKSAPSGRAELIDFGNKLDKDTGGKWVLDEIQGIINSHDRVLIDSVRIQPQIDVFRAAYGQAVVHIHLHAPEEWRKARFIERAKTTDFINKSEAEKKFEEYSNDSTEKGVRDFNKNADLVIYSKDSEGGKDQVVRAAGFLRLLPSLSTKNVDVIVGGQFGSEGKGQVAAYMSPEYECLVRVGGPNAGHKVYSEPDPLVFHILPSGSTKAMDAQLVIGPGAVINEETILNEIASYGIAPERLTIDENATIISKDDINKEKGDKIGSTGQGVGAATANNILARLKASDTHKAKNSKKLKQYLGQAHDVFQKLHLGNKKILIEGTQGTLLSLHHGYYPFVTSRDTTVNGCLAECGIGPNRIRKIVMVTRRYPIRVKSPIGGTSGDFYSTEISLEKISERANYPIDELKKTEITTTTKKKRRIAEFSWHQYRKACEFNTPTDIALTFADYIDYSNQQARRYDQLTANTTKFIEELERCAGVPVSLIATRFSYRSIIDRRNWI